MTKPAPIFPSPMHREPAELVFATEDVTTITDANGHIIGYKVKTGGHPRRATNAPNASPRQSSARA